MSSNQKEKLILLIKTSKTLGEEKKTFILNAVEILNEDKVLKLIEVFENSRKKYDEIMSKYEGVMKDVKKEYLEKANEYTSKEITDLFHEWEIVEKQKDEKELEKIEKEIDQI